MQKRRRISALQVYFLVILSVGIFQPSRCASDLSDFLYFVQQSRLPQSFAYSARAGFSPGSFGSEHVTVVLPPITVPGRSRLNTWYTIPRSGWINATIDKNQQNLTEVCKNASQPWVHCVFRWMHFLRQREKLEELPLATIGAFKSALKRNILQDFSFRLEFVAFYCHLRRALQLSERGITPNPIKLYSKSLTLCKQITIIK